MVGFELSDWPCVMGHAPPTAGVPSAESDCTHFRRPLHLSRPRSSAYPSASRHFRSLRPWLGIIPGCNCHGRRLFALAMDVELRAAREAFTIRYFEACHLEATDGSAARQGAPLAAPKLRSRTPVKLSGVSRQVAPPRQGEAARPTQVFDPFAAQAQGTHRSRILQEEVGALRPLSSSARDHH